MPSRQPNWREKKSGRENIAYVRQKYVEALAKSIEYIICSNPAVDTRECKTKWKIEWEREVKRVREGEYRILCKHKYCLCSIHVVTVDAHGWNRFHISAMNHTHMKYTSFTFADFIEDIKINRKESHDVYRVYQQGVKRW